MLKSSSLGWVVDGRQTKKANRLPSNPCNSFLGVRMVVVMMAVVVMVLREQRTREHHQEQSCCKKSLHGPILLRFHPSQRPGLHTIRV
jgi:hypothetical protein